MNKTKRSVMGMMPRMFGHRAGKTMKKRHDGAKHNHNHRSFAKHFIKVIAINFLTLLNIVKLYHWKTMSFAGHKASDELYSSLSTNIDKFIEILLGKTGERIDLMGTNTLKLKNLSEIADMKREVNAAKQFLVSLDKSSDMKIMYNSDLFNVRDEILGDLNQFLYLLTLK